MSRLMKIARSFDSAAMDKLFPKCKKLAGKSLANYFNYINFRDSTLIVALKNKSSGSYFFRDARPQPTLGSELTCLWADGQARGDWMLHFDFMFILASNGLDLVLMTPPLQTLSPEGVSFDITDTCGYEVGTRGSRRHPSGGVSVTLMQSGMSLEGALSDFNSRSFRVELPSLPEQAVNSFNVSAPVYAVLRSGDQIVYSAECEITRHAHSHDNMTVVMNPIADRISRLRQKEFRSTRQKLKPSPNIVFVHPLTGSTVILKAEEISGSGFSLVEEYADSVLLPGMIVPEINIEFAMNLRIKCSAQVVYRKVLDTPAGGSTCVKCGMAIVDMDAPNQVSLSNILHQAINENSYVGCTVDLDELWRFFFHTGFIYPNKYAHMHADKEHFKEVYRRLYLTNSDVARHFVYQDRGKIKAHIAMLRFYRSMWLIHHHAASRAGGRGGIVILNQLVRYLNDYHSLNPVSTVFAGCYFRPENRFPERVFGGFAKEVDNKKRCSTDEFAYFLYDRGSAKKGGSLGDMVLEEAEPQELAELENFYEFASGGLAVRALDLQRDFYRDATVDMEFADIGLKRQRRLFALRQGGVLSAVFALNLSDFGLNFSNLTNCIQAFVLTPSGLSRGKFMRALSHLSEHYGEAEVPVLIYPKSYADKVSIEYEKTYKLWLFNMEYTDMFFKYIDKTFGLNNHAKGVEAKREVGNGEN